MHEIHAVNRRRRIIGIVLLGLLAAILVSFLSTGEPSYQGRKLSGWLKDLDNQTPTTREKAREAVGQIGTNALPILLEMVGSRDTGVKYLLMVCAEKLSMARLRITPASERRWRAVLAFRALGSKAESAIPALNELLGEEDIAYDVTQALAGIGSAAVLPLTHALTNENVHIQFSAVKALGSLRFNAEPAVPALLPLLKENDHLLRYTTAIALGEIGKHPAEVLPALSEALGDTNASVRLAAAVALGAFEDRAQAAIPVLLKAMEDSDSAVRRAAGAAMQRIDPGAKANLK